MFNLSNSILIEGLFNIDSPVQHVHHVLKWWKESWNFKLLISDYCARRTWDWPRTQRSLLEFRLLSALSRNSSTSYSVRTDMVSATLESSSSFSRRRPQPRRIELCSRSANLPYHFLIVLVHAHSLNQMLIQCFSDMNFFNLQTAFFASVLINK